MAVEYGPSVEKEEIERARAEVEQALLNLLEMKDLIGRLQSAKKLITQRPLSFPHLQVNFRAVPGLIAFYDLASQTGQALNLRPLLGFD